MPTQSFGICACKPSIARYTTGCERYICAFALGRVAHPLPLFDTHTSVLFYKHARVKKNYTRADFQLNQSTDAMSISKLLAVILMHATHDCRLVASHPSNISIHCTPHVISMAMTHAPAARMDELYSR